jgi:hypothetical protein
MENQIQPAETTPASTDVITVIEYNGVPKMYDDSDLIPRQAVLDIILKDDSLSGNPLTEVPFFTLIKMVLVMVFRPFKSARFAANATKRELYIKVRDFRMKE